MLYYKGSITAISCEPHTAEEPHLFPPGDNEEQIDVCYGWPPQYIEQRVLGP